MKKTYIAQTDLDGGKTKIGGEISLEESVAKTLGEKVVKLKEENK